MRGRRLRLRSVTALTASVVAVASAWAAPPANDDCAAAISVARSDRSLLGSAVESTADGASICGPPGAPDVWFRHVADVSGPVIISSAGSGFDTVISVHTGCPGAAENELVCGDDLMFNGTFADATSEVALSMTEGETVWLRLAAGFGGGAGAYALLVTGPTSPVFQNGFESADACAWHAATPAASCDPGMVFVPAGELMMGSELISSAEAPVHAVYLDAYWIDRREVSVADYVACVTAGGCSVPNATYSSNPGAFEHACNYGAQSRTEHPVNCLAWSKASAFCAWKGKRLPWEAEWEKAARGVYANTWPWGNQRASCSYAVMEDPAAGGRGCGLASTAAVGSKPSGASPYGADDMAGNVWEWVADWYSSTYYTVSPYSNPHGPADGFVKGLRGGAWEDWSGAGLLAAARLSGIFSWDPDYGFRCARDD